MAAGWLLLLLLLWWGGGERHGEGWLVASACSDSLTLLEELGVSELLDEDGAVGRWHDRVLGLCGAARSAA